MDLLRPDQIDELRTVFSVADTNGNGVLIASELKVVFNSFGENLSRWEVNDLIAEIDVGESAGTIDFPEFLKLMTRTLSQSSVTFANPEKDLSPPPSSNQPVTSSDSLMSSRGKKKKKVNMEDKHADRAPPPATYSLFSNITETEFADLFKELDLDNDNEVSIHDLQKAFAGIGDNYDIELIREMVAEVGTTAVAGKAPTKFSLDDLKGALSP